MSFDYEATTTVNNLNMTLDGSNIGYQRERVEAWARGERVAPIFIDVAWTRRCQAACYFCAAQTQASEGGIITREHAISFLEDSAEIGVLAMNYISDGESTMVPWYAESVERATDLGIQIGAGTNGIATTQPVLERILPRLASFRVNFSAGEKKRYAEIMGLKQAVYDIVIGNIKTAVKIVRDNELACITNMNLVCDPDQSDQLIPFARLAKDLGVHYAIIKHCWVDTHMDGKIAVDYKGYARIEGILKECEALSDENTKIVVKWNKLNHQGERQYSKCFGPPFALQMSGNGLIAPCGPLFNEKWRAFHIGNITQHRFKDIFESERYWEVMKYLGSDEFDPRKRCPSDCMQNLTNKWLYDYLEGKATFPIKAAPANANFLA
ncbi:MAG: radical SAM protein [Rhodospirillaceae bacterium]|nr:MAG: radical SAM protein [Rhodospirillaceae bacterium]